MLKLISFSIKSINILSMVFEIVQKVLVLRFSVSHVVSHVFMSLLLYLFSNET